MHSHLIELQLHCYRLLNFFRNNDDLKLDLLLQFDLIEWLEKASSVKNVQIDINQFKNDDEIVELISHKSDNELFSKISKALLVFNFLYSSFDLLASNLNLPQIPESLEKRDNTRKGKVNKVCYLLKTRFESKFQLLKGYNQLIGKLKQLLSASPIPIYQGNKELVELFSGKEFIGESGLGLFVSYKIRNQFAHGSYVFQYCNEEYFHEPFTENVLNICSQILLFTIQMLLITEIDSFLDAKSGEKSREQLVNQLINLHLN